jgi:hypothetical protein
VVEHQELTVLRWYEIQWRRQDIDLTELAKRRWIEKWSIEKLAEHFRCGPTHVKRSLNKIKADPDLAKADLGYRKKRPWSLDKKSFRGIK